MIGDELLAQARAWLAQDPDPDTRAELEPLILARSSELVDRFAGPLKFGTAGLRGILGAGESRMNRAVVRRASAALATYLLAHEPEATTRPVVVGYDGRRLSKELAHDTAATLCAAGIKVALADRLCPTPLVAFAVTALDAIAGVMVTASHNPPQYNGYKVYARNGAQIIAPADARIAAAMDAGPPADRVPLMDLEAAREHGLLSEFGEPMRRNYLSAIATLADRTSGDRTLSIVYTPLHGVGGELFTRGMHEAGFSNVRTVAEQAEPDGQFPTVAFPNPEEKGALDLALELAKKERAALILANDPDADRLAAVVRGADGQYVALSGNDIGVLLGNFALERDAKKGLAGRPLVITTVVSSPLLGVIARAHDAAYDETLTGFKWIANRAMEREAQEGVRFVFGYEEALGYSVGTVARDKDGISAAVVLATLAAELHQRGRTLLDELARIGENHGAFLSQQRSLSYPGAQGAPRMAAIMSKLRDNPPPELGGFQVTATIDCARSVRRDGTVEEPLMLPKSDVLIFELAHGHRVIARPSGTEPKLKIYIDVRQPPSGDPKVARAHAATILAALEADVVARVAS